MSVAAEGARSGMQGRKKANSLCLTSCSQAGVGHEDNSPQANTRPDLCTQSTAGHGYGKRPQLRARQVWERSDQLRGYDTWD